MELPNAPRRLEGMDVMRNNYLSAVVFVATLAIGALVAACSDKEEEPVPSMDVSVNVEVSVNGAPVNVAVTQPASGGQGWSPYGFVHEVRVTSNADQPVRIDDARFAHELRRGDGTLVTAGRGCGANWDEETEGVFIACTDDLQLIRLEPGETHAYPVTIYPEVGPAVLRPGTYAVEERIPWWFVGDDPFETGGEPEGTFTVRLTYVVE